MLLPTFTRIRESISSQSDFSKVNLWILNPLYYNVFIYCHFNQIQPRPAEMNLFSAALLGALSSTKIEGIRCKRLAFANAFRDHDQRLHLSPNIWLYSYTVNFLTRYPHSPLILFDKVRIQDRKVIQYFLKN